MTLPTLLPPKWSVTPQSLHYWAKLDKLKQMGLSGCLVVSWDWGDGRGGFQEGRGRASFEHLSSMEEKIVLSRIIIFFAPHTRRLDQGEHTRILKVQIFTIFLGFLYADFVLPICIFYAEISKHGNPIVYCVRSTY